MWYLPHLYADRLIHVHIVSCGVQQTHTAQLRDKVITTGRRCLKPQSLTGAVDKN